MIDVGEKSKQLKRWAAIGSEYVFACFDAALPFMDKNYEATPEVIRFVVGQLFASCNATSESALILIQADKEWDADILSRSVMEGTVKLAYMLTGSNNEIAERVKEYWEYLPLFNAARHNERARALLAEPLTLQQDKPVFDELTLDDAEVQRIRAEWPKARRKSLEESWSLPGILKGFSGSGSESLKLLAHLAHGYGMSSHLLHKDADGVGMIWERSRRGEERRQAVSLGHSARIISDQCVFAKLRLHFLLKACGEQREQIANIDAKFQFLFDELRSASDCFYKIEYGEDGGA